MAARGRGGDPTPPPPEPVEPTTARVGCYRSDNSLIDGSEIEAALVPGGGPGRRQVQMPSDYVIPDGAVYIRVDVEGEEPFILPIATDPDERAEFGLMVRRA